jgi:hypothetical protein
MTQCTNISGILLRGRNPPIFGLLFLNGCSINARRDGVVYTARQNSAKSKYLTHPRHPGQRRDAM